MVRLTRGQAQEQTHERLLAAGRSVFLRRGFLAATVEEVAAEAGYTRGAVYKHFGGKEGLWHALVEEQSEMLLDGLRAALRRVGTRAALLATLNPGAAVADPGLTRWALVSAEAMAALGAKPEDAARVAAVQVRFDGEMVTALGDCCDRLGLRPAMPLPQLVAAWGALGAGLAMRHALDDTTDLAAVAAGVLAALLPASEQQRRPSVKHQRRRPPARRQRRRLPVRRQGPCAPWRQQRLSPTGEVAAFFPAGEEGPRRRVGVVLLGWLHRQHSRVLGGIAGAVSHADGRPLPRRTA